MHILFATTDFVENNGPTTGLPKYLLRTSLKMVEWGHDVTVVTCSNRTVQYEFYGINVYRIRSYNIEYLNDEYKDEIRVCLRNAQIIHKAISEIITKKRIDIIQYTNLSGVAYYHDFKIPAIVRLSSYAKMWPLIGQEERTRARTKMELEAADKCDAIIGPSYVVANEFSKDIGQHVDVIETPFVMENIITDDSLYKSLLRGKTYLLFFGTLVEYKGVSVIAEAIYRIFSAFPSFHFVVIGDGNKDLVRKIKDNAKEYADRVIYHEAVGFGMLIPIIQESYAVILPSLMENFSNACVEAMALKKIVIGTNGASFEQLITNGKNGLLCEPNDSDSLYQAVCSLMQLGREEKVIMEENAYRRTLELKPEKVTAQLIQYYEKVIFEYR